MMPAIEAAGLYLEHIMTCPSTKQNFIDARNVDKSTTVSPPLLRQTRHFKSGVIF